MKIRSVLLTATLLALPFAASAGDSPGADKEFLGIESCKKGKFDCEWVSPDFSFKGKTIHVERFKKVADPPKGEDYGSLKWKNCDEYMQEVFANITNERVDKWGVKFVTGGSGEYTMKGQITEFRYPKKGAAWGGWIGQAAGSGTIVWDWKIVDKSGKTVAAVHHKTLASASDTLENRVDNVHSDQMLDFVKLYAK